MKKCLAALAVVACVTSCTPKQIETGVDVLCRTRPDLCAPRPVPTVEAATPTPTPDACTADPDYAREDCCGKCGPGETCARAGRCGGNACFNCFPVTPTSSPSPTATPSPAPSALPTATPGSTPTCVPKPGPEPVTLIYRGGCPRHMEPLDFEGEGNVNAPADKRLCAVKAGAGDRRTAWRLGYGLGRQGMQLTRFGDAWLQFDPGRGCTDAYGRHFEDCATLYEHPEGPSAPYTWGGYEVPVFCGDATPTPAPTAGPTPTPAGPVAAYPCIVVATVAHLGHNDNPGLPAGVVLGGEASIDLTLRGARSPGDGRGAACDKAPWTCACEPERAPVAWMYDVPGGVEVRQFNNGYGLSLRNLQPGHYRVTTALQPGMLNGCGEPIQVCPWSHGGEGAGVRDVLEFDIQ